MLQTAWRRTYYNELRERAHAEKEIQGLWQVHRAPRSARRHVVASALLKGSTARNGDGGAQALVRRVTQQRALWALSPAFDMWQLDRTEGRCAPHDRVTSRMPVELTAVLLSDRLVRRRSGPYRVRARLARPEREPPFVVPRAEDGGFRGWEQGAPLCVDPLLDPLLAGILKLTLEPCDAGLYGDTASNAQGVGSGSGDVDEDSTAEALDAARDELLVRVMGPACAASFHEPFRPRGSPAGLRTGLSSGLCQLTFLYPRLLRHVGAASGNAGVVGGPADDGGAGMSLIAPGEEVQFHYKCLRVTPFLQTEGMLLIGKHKIYFNEEAEGSAGFGTGKPASAWAPLQRLRRAAAVCKQRTDGLRSAAGHRGCATQLGSPAAASRPTPRRPAAACGAIASSTSTWAATTGCGRWTRSRTSTGGGTCCATTRWSCSSPTARRTYWSSRVSPSATRPTTTYAAAAVGGNAQVRGADGAPDPGGDARVGAARSWCRWACPTGPRPPRTRAGSWSSAAR